MTYEEQERLLHSGGQGSIYNFSNSLGMNKQAICEAIQALTRVERKGAQQLSELAKRVQEAEQQLTQARQAYHRACATQLRVVADYKKLTADLTPNPPAMT